MSLSPNNRLERIIEKGNLRSLPDLRYDGKYICDGSRRMLNLSSNDYLGLASLSQIRAEFYHSLQEDDFRFGATSSRLLTGNSEEYRLLESKLATLYHSRSALVYDSGYHANIGILPAVTTRNSLILADKYVHASLIDGIRLSAAECIRFRHNDLEQLAMILDREQKKHDLIVIVTESIYSMDGDQADLRRLVQLKKKYDNVFLYVDEAHAVGVRGEQGLGCAEEQNIISDIDFLIGTFGKAFASYGAFLICDQDIRNFLINTSRSLIFTTALPPINLKWSLFTIKKIVGMGKERDHLHHISGKIRQCIQLNHGDIPSTSHIIPYVVGDSHRTSLLAKEMQQKGFYVLPIRPPTVPEGTSRLRISITAACTGEETADFLQVLKQLK